MEPALDVVHRVLHGDANARAFLERTTALYVLDLTDPAKPKTYGCWNFIHQAMNEVERYEDRQYQDSLEHHVRLVATMALKVARRSPTRDKALVSTAVANADISDTHLPWLVEVNGELREIVMGRIAATALDASLATSRRNNGHRPSAFADAVVTDSLCAALAANAIATGPKALQHFVEEWIVPSAPNLPPLACLSVITHLAVEGARDTTPIGTKNLLQRVTNLVIGHVAAPLLALAVQQDVQTNDEMSSSPQPPHHQKEAVIRACLRCLQEWCHATDLSLPLVRHICSKVSTPVDILEVWSDLMYADAAIIIDALADLAESTVVVNMDRTVALSRMNQVRHIMQVDEATFRSGFTADHLEAIERQELAVIAEELSSAIGLQRFRFDECMANGRHDVCRNLARIAATVCGTIIDLQNASGAMQLENGLTVIILKSAGYPLFDIASLALPALSRAMALSISLSLDAMPTLQRQAILPHHFHQGRLHLSDTTQNGNAMVATGFREDVLTGALQACAHSLGPTYSKSCLTAVDEFSTSSSALPSSMHLEAALFCIDVAISDDKDVAADLAGRLVASLTSQPASLAENPFTLARSCQLISKMAPTLSPELSDACVPMLLSALNASTRPTSFVNVENISAADLASSSARALQVLLSRHLSLSSANVSLLSGAWSAAVSSNHLSLANRIALGTAVCSAIAAVTIDGDQPLVERESVVLRPLIRNILSNAKDLQKKNDDSSLLPRICSQLRLAAQLVVVCSGTTSKAGAKDTGCALAFDQPTEMSEGIFDALKVVDGIASEIVTAHGHDTIVVGSIVTYLTKLLPRNLWHRRSKQRLDDSHRLLHSLINQANDKRALCAEVKKFVKAYVQIYDTQLAAVDPPRSSIESDVALLLEAVIVALAASAQDLFGNVWDHAQCESSRQIVPNGLASNHKPFDALGEMLQILQSLVTACPHVALRSRKTLLQPGIRASLESLDNGNTELAHHSATFLRALFVQASHSNADARQLVRDVVHEHGAKVTGTIIQGVCGMCARSLLDDLVALLSTLAQVASSELEGAATAALRQEHFMLGDPARHCVLRMLNRRAQHVVNDDDFVRFWHELWRLHQAESPETLAVSDGVARFLQRYQTV